MKRIFLSFLATFLLVMFAVPANTVQADVDDWIIIVHYDDLSYDRDVGLGLACDYSYSNDEYSLTLGATAEAYRPEDAIWDSASGSASVSDGRTYELFYTGYGEPTPIKATFTVTSSSGCVFVDGEVMGIGGNANSASSSANASFSSGPADAGLEMDGSCETWSMGSVNHGAWWAPSDCFDFYSPAVNVGASEYGGSRCFDQTEEAFEFETTSSGTSFSVSASAYASASVSTDDDEDMAIGEGGCAVSVSVSVSIEAAE